MNPKQKLSETEKVAKIERFGFDKRPALRTGARVEIVIGSEFQPNGRGAHIHIAGRFNGLVEGLDKYGNWIVTWPDGKTYTYQASILAVTS